MAVLPDIVMVTAEVTIDDIQVGDPDVSLADDHERLRQLIGRNKHLRIDKGSALPPAARGAICDIDVGGSSPIAQRVRPVPPTFREKKERIRLKDYYQPRLLDLPYHHGLRRSS